MKIKRHKRVRKILQFYALSYNIHQPYKVVVDPAFIQACREGHLMIKDQLPTLFHAPTTAYITPCILHHLQLQGGAAAAAYHIASTLSFLSCRHKKKGKIHPDACIKALVTPQWHLQPGANEAAQGAEGKAQEGAGGFNPDRLIVAAQGRELREWVRGQAGVPLLFVHGSVPVMEAPSGTDRFDRIEKARTAMATLTEEEKKAVEGVEEKGAGKETGERRGPPRKKKVKGPNPMSVKKKKKSSPAARPSTSQKDGSAGGDGSGEATKSGEAGKRKRREEGEGGVGERQASVEDAKADGRTKRRKVQSTGEDSSAAES